MKQDLLKQATAARENAHVPYSKYKVGAAVALENGKIYSGANIENASYGGTVCAERVAIWKAISENGATPIKEIVVVTDAPEAWPPCGLCRQVMAEFCTNETIVHTANLQGFQKTYKFSDLLPNSFTPDFLK